MCPKASALALALAVVTVAAAESPSQTPGVTPSSSSTRLAAVRGPIKITAERADLEQRETALYRGNVRLVSPDLELTGDRLELKQPAKGQFEVKLTGKPARLKHQGHGETPPVSASAREIHYDTRRGVVDMMGGARLQRGTDVVTSETIRYELAARRISASGVGDAQVQIVIHPPETTSPDPARPQNGQNSAPAKPRTAPQPRPE